MVCLRMLIDANHVRLSGVKSWNGLTSVWKRGEIKGKEERSITHVIRRITHVNDLRNQRQGRKVNYARYKGDNARKFPLTYVRFMLTYVRHCFLRIRVFDD